MFKNKKALLIAGLLIIVIGIGSYYYYTTTLAVAAQDEAEPEVQTAVVRVGDITVSATGAGTVIAADEITLGFSTGGTLTELLVGVGSKVATGDVLARVNESDAQEALLTAQLQLKQAAFSTDPTATAAGVSLSDITVEQARLTLASAQSTLDDLLNWEPDPDEIALAEANLAAAQAGYSAAAGQVAVSSNSITLAQINLDQVTRSLADAEAAYTTAYDPGREWEFGIPRMADALEAEREAADRNLLKAQENLTIAQTEYNSAVSGVSVSGKVSAQTSVLSAEQALATAQNGPDEDEIETAQVAVRQAELALQQALINQQADVLSWEQAELAVAAAEQAVADTELIAPMDGTITAVTPLVLVNCGSTRITRPVNVSSGSASNTTSTS